jgi:hypothetical protein
VVAGPSGVTAALGTLVTTFNTDLAAAMGNINGAISNEGGLISHLGSMKNAFDSIYTNIYTEKTGIIAALGALYTKISAVALLAPDVTKITTAIGNIKTGAEGARDVLQEVLDKLNAIADFEKITITVVTEKKNPDEPDPLRAADDIIRTLASDALASIVDTVRTAATTPMYSGVSPVVSNISHISNTQMNLNMTVQPSQVPPLMSSYALMKSMARTRA